MSDNRFIKFIPSEESDYLQEHHPNAFLLLALIAKRARRVSGKPDGLEIGEAHIGDYKKAGIETEKKYRTAKKVLEGRGHLVFLETCRNRKKGATGRATIGTKVRLLKSDIWDINSEAEGDRKGNRGATEGRPKGDEQECKKKEKKEEEKEAKASKKKPPIFFNRSTNQFENLNPEFLKVLKETYPTKAIEQELGKMRLWLMDPKHGGKVGNQQFITGWIDRSNDAIIPPVNHEPGIDPEPYFEEIIKRRKQCATTSPSFTTAENPSAEKEEPILQAVD